MIFVNVKKIAVLMFVTITTLAQNVFADNDVAISEIADVDTNVVIVPTTPIDTAKTKNKIQPAADGRRRERDETEFRMSGILETGFDIHRRTNNAGISSSENRHIARGEIDISARPARRLRAEIGVEYNQRDTFLTVDKFYAQYSPSREGIIRAGIMKKSFGLEERTGSSERYFYRRSIINSELENLQVNNIDDVGFLGHDLTLLYRHDIKKDFRVIGAYSWSVEDSTIFFQNYSAQYTKDSLFIVLATIVRHHAIKDAGTTFATSLSARYNTERAKSEIEFTLASHPWFLKNHNFNSYLYGLRLQTQFPIDVNTETLRRIIPLAEVAMLYKDIPNELISGSGNFYLANVYNRLDTQIRAGLTLAFTRNYQFQWRNTFGTTLRMQTNDNDEWETRTWRRYRFDTQAVVIF